jgi:hypothetical protein
MIPLRNFFCVYYFDRGAEDFELYAIFSKREEADAALAELPDDIKPKCVVESNLAGVKQQVLQRAVRDAMQLRNLIGEDGTAGLERTLRDSMGFPVATVTPE